MIIRIRILDGGKSEIFRDQIPLQNLPRAKTQKSNYPVASVKFDSRAKTKLEKNLDFFEEEVQSPFSHLFSPHQTLLTSHPASNPSVQYNTFPLSISHPPSSLTPRTTSPATPVVVKSHSSTPLHLPSTLSLPCPILPSSFISSPTSRTSTTTPFLPSPSPPVPPNSQFPPFPASVSPLSPQPLPPPIPRSSHLPPLPPTASNVGPH